MKAGTPTQGRFPVRVRLSNQALAEDLKAYLEAAECSIRVVGQVTLDVAMRAKESRLRASAAHPKAGPLRPPERRGHSPRLCASTATHPAFLSRSAMRSGTWRRDDALLRLSAHQPHDNQ